MPVNTLVNKDFITSMLTVDDPWCSSHGADNGSEDLGAGLLYYSLAYSIRARTCVCLGSGGGFVPRLMRQAQRDLDLEGGRTILVDSCPTTSVSITSTSMQIITMTVHGGTGICTVPWYPIMV